MSDGAERLLIFSLRGIRYAVGLEEVAEVMESATIWPVPMSPGWMAGAIDFHGSIVAVVDPAAFLFGGSAARGDKLLVLDERSASCAFIVERVEKIIHRDAVLEERPVDAFPIKAEIVTAEGNAGVLALEQLLVSLGEAVNEKS